MTTDDNSSQARLINFIQLVKLVNNIEFDINQQSFPLPDQTQSERFTYTKSILHKSCFFCTRLQFCFVFHTTFPLSPFFLVLELCTQYIEKIQHPKLSMYFLLCYSKHKEKCNVTHSVCIWCNVLRTGRMGTLKRLNEIHSKIATLHKIHRICVTLTQER